MNVFLESVSTTAITTLANVCPILLVNSAQVRKFLFVSIDMDLFSCGQHKPLMSYFNSKNFSQLGKYFVLKCITEEHEYHSRLLCNYNPNCHKLMLILNSTTSKKKNPYPIILAVIFFPKSNQYMKAFFSFQEIVASISVSAMELALRSVVGN